MSGVGLMKADAASAGLLIAAQLPRPGSRTARRCALTMISTMIGALTLARVVDDPALSDAILKQVVGELL